MTISKEGLSAKIKSISVEYIVKSQEPLIRLANLLDWNLMYNLILNDLKKTQKKFWFVGRRLQVRIHLAAMILQCLFKLTDRQTEESIRWNPLYKVFCGFGIMRKWHCPDHTKIEEFRNRLSAETQKLIGEYILQIALQAGFANPSWMDVDSTVSEANMSYPADCNILKKLALKVHKVVEFLREKKNKLLKEVDIKRICKKARSYFFLAKNATVEKKREVFQDYFLTAQKELRGAIKGIKELSARIHLPWNIQQAAVMIQEKSLKYFSDLKYFIRTHEMKKGKILCLHLSAVACISKGKVEKKNEFGRQIQLGRIGGNFIVPLSEEVKMEDKRSLVPMVETHTQIFGQGSLREIGTDKGYFSQDNIDTISAMGINTDGVQRPVNIKRQPSSEITELLRDRRAGIEPLIGHLKSFGLRKSKMKSDASTHASVYRCTMGFNIHQLMRHMEGKFKAA